MARGGRQILLEWADRAGALTVGIQRAVFLGDDCRFGAAREASLKMLEMTAGRVASMAQSYMGLRHGPMSFIDDRTLIVCFLSSDELTRQYQTDLILELNAKRLGARRVIAGAETLERGSAVRRTWPFHTRAGGTPDEDLAVLDAMIGQILGILPLPGGRASAGFPVRHGRDQPGGGRIPDPPCGGCGEMKILIAGELNPDLILRDYQMFPQPGKEVLVEDLELTLGSSSAICAVGLARLGDAVTFAATVGADVYGDYSTDMLRRGGIDVSLVQRRADLKTGSRFPSRLPGTARW